MAIPTIVLSIFRHAADIFLFRRQKVIGARSLGGDAPPDIQQPIKVDRISEISAMRTIRILIAIPILQLSRTSKGRHFPSLIPRRVDAAEAQYPH